MRGGRNPQSPIPEVGDRGPPPPALFCANQRRKLRPFSLWSTLPKSAKVAIGPPKRGDLVILEPKQRTNLQKTPGAMRSDDVEVSLGFSDAGLGREAGAGCSPPPALGRGAPRASEARGVRSGGVAGCLHAVWAMRGGANSVPPILHTRNSHEGLPPPPPPWPGLVPNHTRARAQPRAAAHAKAPPFSHVAGVCAAPAGARGFENSECFLRAEDPHRPLILTQAGRGVSARGAGCSPPPALGRGALRASWARGVRFGGVAVRLRAARGMRGRGKRGVAHPANPQFP